MLDKEKILRQETYLVMQLSPVLVLRELLTSEERMHKIHIMHKLFPGTIMKAVTATLDA